MNIRAFATDYDGTLAHHGVVSPETLAALSRLRASGRTLIMVTGRRLDDLQLVFPDYAIFDWIVAENGALLYRPQDETLELLTDPPPPELQTEIQRRNIPEVYCGHVIVACWEAELPPVQEVLSDLHLDWHIIMNKGAVMALPAGVDKALGLAAALQKLDIPAAQTVAIGDAENDEHLLDFAGIGVATANALPELKARADFVTRGDHGYGVQELIEQILHDDLKRLTQPRLQQSSS